MKRKFFIAVLVLLAISFGFLRDYIFVSINEKTGMGLSGSGILFFGKWFLTFVFGIIYLSITCLFLHLLFANKKYIRLAIVIYTAFFLFSFIIAGIGFAFFSFEKVYPLVRSIMGVAQSPIVMMILIPFCLINERLIVNEKK